MIPPPGLNPIRIYGRRLQRIPMSGDHRNRHPPHRLSVAGPPRTTAGGQPAHRAADPTAQYHRAHPGMVPEPLLEMRDKVHRRRRTMEPVPSTAEPEAANCPHPTTTMSQRMRTLVLLAAMERAEAARARTSRLPRRKRKSSSPITTSKRS